jgi:hypothetical protein
MFFDPFFKVHIWTLFCRVKEDLHQLVLSTFKSKQVISVTRSIFLESTRVAIHEFMDFLELHMRSLTIPLLIQGGKWKCSEQRMQHFSEKATSSSSELNMLRLADGSDNSSE